MSERYRRTTVDGGTNAGVAWVRVLVCRDCGSLVNDSKGDEQTHDRFHASLTVVSP